MLGRFSDDYHDYHDGNDDDEEEEDDDDDDDDDVDYNKEDNTWAVRGFIPVRSRRSERNPAS